MSIRRFAIILLAAALLALPAAAVAQEDFTQYELLEPGSARFAITYDTTAGEGTSVYLNPVRRGSIATDERVVDLITGQELPFTMITGAQAKAEGLRGDRVADDDEFLRIELPGIVPVGAEARIRIFKTYEDAGSYQVDGETVVFARGLGIRANAVVLPPGYELIASATPGMVSTLADGRVKVSFLNDRDDTLPVRVVGRRVGGGAR